MKYVKWIFVLFLFSSLTSFVEKNTPTGGLNIGERAPDFRIVSIDDDNRFNLKSLRGEYVLINFWASYDAKSRMSNVMLSNKIQDLDLNVKMVSISFDEYSSIFNETVRKDKILSSLCFVETSGEASSIFRTYRLDKGFQSYLLDERGVIIAKGVDAASLTDYLN